MGADRAVIKCHRPAFGKAGPSASGLSRNRRAQSPTWGASLGLGEPQPACPSLSLFLAATVPISDMHILPLFSSLSFFFSLILPCPTFRTQGGFKASFQAEYSRLPQAGSKLLPAGEALAAIGEGAQKAAETGSSAQRGSDPPHLPRRESVLRGSLAYSRGVPVLQWHMIFIKPEDARTGFS